MRNLFRSFERFGVRHLLISGQASVLYGAATFSEDVDIWVQAASANLRRLLRALASVRARVYKLTPPVTPRFARAGHGFHFTVPANDLPVYLDVMAKPPRVRSFGAAWARRRLFDSPWGPVAVVSIADLVELKKTRRLSDYEVISNLVEIRLREPDAESRLVQRWALRNAFRAELRHELRRRAGLSSDLETCRRDIAREVARLQKRDVTYWRRRIAELRRLRAAGRLVPLGTDVKELL